MKKNKTYNWWLVSNNIIKRSIANVWYNILWTIIIWIIVAIFMWIFMWIFMLTTKILSLNSTPDINTETLTNTWDNKESIISKDWDKELKDNLNEV